MQLDLPQQGEQDWYKKFIKALRDAGNQVDIDRQTRNFTLTNGATKSNAGDAMYIWRVKTPYADFICGEGKVNIGNMNNGDHFDIITPFDINAGDFVIGSCFTYNFRPYFQCSPDSNGGIWVYTDGVTTPGDCWINFFVAHIK